MDKKQQDMLKDAKQIGMKVKLETRDSARDVSWREPLKGITY